MTRSGLLTVLMSVTALAAFARPVEWSRATTVVLTGPTDADPNSICTWTATASGGTGPYTFSWDWNLARGDVSGTVGYSSEFTGHVAGAYMFIVTATDVNNVSDADTLYGASGSGIC